MGIKETFQKAAVTSFNAAGNLVETVSYVKQADDGFGTASQDKKEQSLKLLREDLSRVYQSGVSSQAGQFYGVEILGTDVVGKIPCRLCAYPLEEGAIITLAEGAFMLKKTSIDPAGALYSVLLRRA